MTKYNFQFEQEKDSLRPCRMIIQMLDHNHRLPAKVCGAMNDNCDGLLFSRPDWCPLTVVEDKEESDRSFFDALRERAKKGER
jgi:hypothetical protein